MARIESAYSLATQTRPPPSAIALGAWMTEILASSVPVTGSSRETVPSRLFATQIEPFAASTSAGPLPTSWVKVTSTVSGSMRATLDGATATHTPSGVNATAEGVLTAEREWSSLSQGRR